MGFCHTETYNCLKTSIWRTVKSIVITSLPCTDPHTSSDLRVSEDILVSNTVIVLFYHGVHIAKLSCVDGTHGLNKIK